MGRTIRRCTAWGDRHEGPRYTLSETCPDCDAPTEPAAPAPYNPADPYGSYRRAMRERQQQ